MATDIPAGHDSPPSLPLTNSAGRHLLSGEAAAAAAAWPSLSEVVEEARAIGRVAGPTAITGLVLYSRSMVSMLFLGRLGELALAGGSLALGFANITGYSLLSGLALGMDPICGQAFGARRGKLLALALHRTVLLLLAVAFPIGVLWFFTDAVLLRLGQDPAVAAVAKTFAVHAIPDLAVLAVLHPLRVYLRTQNLTLPITACSLFSVLLHLPINYLLVVRLRMGVAGVALAVALTDLNLLLALLTFLIISGAHRDSWAAPTIADCFRGWGELLRLAVPTAAGVCLEWWWYELIIVLSGLLPHPQPAVASMGVLIQATALIYVFPSSLGLATSTRVSHELGAGRPDSARRAAAVAFAISAAVGVTAASFFFSVRRHWARMFTGDEEVVKLTAMALPIIGLCELGNCPQTTGCGVLRGSARPGAGANINLAAFYLIGMPVAVVAGFVAGAGFVGLWLGLLAAQAACAACMVIAVARTDWQREADKARELTKTASSKSQDDYVKISTSDDEEAAGGDVGAVAVKSQDDYVKISTSDEEEGPGGDVGAVVDVEEGAGGAAKSELDV